MKTLTAIAGTSVLTAQFLPLDSLAWYIAAWITVAALTPITIKVVKAAR